MKRYWAYFKSICYHKWLVFIAGYKLNVPVIQLILHDISKCYPSEFLTYARALFTLEGKSTYIDSAAFDLAWILHQHRNKHHWQYWVNIDDSGKITPLPIPYNYISEMIADWLAMEVSVPGSLSAGDYYQKIQKTAYIHEQSRSHIELLLFNYSNYKYQSPDVSTTTSS